MLYGGASQGIQTSLFSGVASHYVVRGRLRREMCEPRVGLEQEKVSATLSLIRFPVRQFFFNS